MQELDGVFVSSADKYDKTATSIATIEFFRALSAP